MIHYSNSKLGKLIVHKLGNKNGEEGTIYSETTLNMESEFLQELLLTFFVSSFKNESFYKFKDTETPELNKIYTSATKIFDDETTFIEQSKIIAGHLYENSNHPKIKGGEFYAVIIRDCMFEDEIFDAVGIFKTEKKDTYIKVQEKNQNFEIQHETGININKLDKGCLIYNTERQNGYIISIVDNINKSKGANFWKDNFLNVKRREDNHFYTEEYLNLCKTFVDKEKKNLEKDEQIELKNKTLEYFNENENFNADDFAEEVISNPETKEAFKEYKQDYEEKNEVNMSDDFDISEDAVKGAKRKFKSVIKLDKNFHIYVHGKQDFIKKGFDHDKNKNFYTLFYDDEK